MGTITPILDTLLPQVFGRRADIERFTATRPNTPLSAITAAVPVREVQSHDSPRTLDTARLQQRGPSDRPAASSRALRSESAAAQAAARDAGYGARASGQAPPAATDGASARAHLTRTGETIARLFGRYDEAPMSTSATRQPLMAAAHVPSAPRLAAALAQQVGASGVFYEPHLLQWFEGRRALSALRAEPHNAMRDGAAATPARRAGEGALAPGQPGSAAALALDGATEDGMDERLLPILRQQFEALHHGVFRWQGLAWPEVPMRWQIEQGERDETNAERRPEADAQRPYVSALHLELPRLGVLEIRIALIADQAQVFAWAEKSRAMDMLRADTATLSQRLEKVGFESVSVRLIEERARDAGRR